MGLETVLGTRRRGFFIPYRYAGTVPEPDNRGPYAAVERRLKTCEPAFAGMLATLDSLSSGLTAIGDRAAPQPRWAQDWFPRLDGAVAYAMVRHGTPATIVEIGSGHSTRFMARAIADAGLSTRFVAIDPAPRAEIATLDIDWRRTTLDNADQTVFDDLAAGDILFVDSSHVAMPGTDVDRIFGHILPALPAGVLVHVHDIFLPDDYPAAWDWRGYNEQQSVLPLLVSRDFEPLFASHYVATRMAGAVSASVAGRLDLRPGALESSLWLRKIAPAL